MALSLRFYSPDLAPYAAYAQYASNPLPYLLHLFEGAQTELEICAGDLSLEPLVAKAAELKKKGIKVRWILGSETSVGEALLTRHGFKRQVDWKVFKSESGHFTQQKMIIIDGTRVLTGSLGLTEQSLKSQDTLDILVHSQEVARVFKAAFECFWKDCGSSQKSTEFWPELIQPVEDVLVGPEQRVSVYFHPYDGFLIREKLTEVISRAEQIIHFAFPCLEDPQLVEALEERAKAGVHIIGVIDSSLAKVEHFRQAPTLRALVRSGKIRVLQSSGSGRTISPTLPSMSLNALTVDYRWVYSGVGSFMGAASNQQAQVALVLDSGSLARQCASDIESILYHVKTVDRIQEEKIAEQVRAQVQAVEKTAAKKLIRKKKTVATRKKKVKTAPAGATSWAKRKARASARKRVVRVRQNQTRKKAAA